MSKKLLGRSVVKCGVLMLVGWMCNTVPVSETALTMSPCWNQVADSLTAGLPGLGDLPYGHYYQPISSFDNLLQQYSPRLGWDWQLLASVLYQESQFNPDARSPKGAFGLMQMMPSTGSDYGVDSTSSPEEQIAAGVRYLAYLDRLMQPVVSNEEERIKFVLAAYNAGPGHVLDAVRLAESDGRLADVWDNNVDSCMLSQSRPEVYNRPEVRNGYCRGGETFAYVRSVMARYEAYRHGRRR